MTDRVSNALNMLRCCTAAAADDSRAAIACGEIDGVVLMSPRTGQIFKELMIRAGLADRAADMTVFCLSAAVAVAADGLPWCNIQTAARPEQDAFMALLTGP